MPTSSSRSARIDSSSPQADHFSSEREYGLARRQDHAGMVGDRASVTFSRRCGRSWSAGRPARRPGAAGSHQVGIAIALSEYSARVLAVRPASLTCAVTRSGELSRRCDDEMHRRSAGYAAATKVRGWSVAIATDLIASGALRAGGRRAWRCRVWELYSAGAARAAFGLAGPRWPRSISARRRQPGAPVTPQAGSTKPTIQAKGVMLPDGPGRPPGGPAGRLRSVHHDVVGSAWQDHGGANHGWRHHPSRRRTIAP